MVGLGFNGRKDKILCALRTNNIVKVPALAKALKVSEVTIRRDLARLEKEGFLIRAYGGAISKEKVGHEFSFQEKLERNKAEKERISKFAATLIQKGDTIFLDTGTTTLHIARALKFRNDLKVVTNSLYVIYELSSAKDIEVILLGGIFRPRSSDLVGPMTEENLIQFYADKAFLGADSITLSNGLMTTDIQTAKIAKMMAESAKEVIVVADHTKFDKRSFVRFAPITKVDKIITSRGIKNSYRNAYKNKGIEIIVV